MVPSRSKWAVPLLGSEHMHASLPKTQAALTTNDLRHSRFYEPQANLAMFAAGDDSEMGVLRTMLLLLRARLDGRKWCIATTNVDATWSASNGPIGTPTNPSQLSTFGSTRRTQHLPSGGQLGFLRDCIQRFAVVGDPFRA